MMKSDKDADNAQFFTAYLYGKYAINDKVGIGARVGYLYNPDGFAGVTGGGMHYADVTLTANYNIGPLRLVPEFRLDYCGDKVFIARDGGGSHLQYRLLMAAIFVPPSCNTLFVPNSI